MSALPQTHLPAGAPWHVATVEIRRLVERDQSSDAAVRLRQEMDEALGRAKRLAGVSPDPALFETMLSLAVIWAGRKDPVERERAGRPLYAAADALAQTVREGRRSCAFSPIELGLPPGDR
ncbi:hypothetical protein [Marinicauda sp. Alg238-R41]|jgi:hypothetical protein|uniref:hypothetical protein n=1 Tax=Marinicauda sp. Alg238-R41 TaxID=2993447 RepID=UPI0022E8F770|nr:hypothetical protein [Marinicauda sp. Alg238-R41]